MKKPFGAAVILFLFIPLMVLSISCPLSAQESLPQHQLKIEADGGTFGKWNIEVWINDQYVGKLEKWEDRDVTSFFKWGKNTVTLKSAWTERTLPVRLTIGVKRGAKWMTAFNYSRRDKGEEVLKEVLTVHKGLPAEPLVEGQYILKIEADGGTFGSWTLIPSINDRQVGTYHCWADADVTPFIKPGRNKATIKGQWIKDTYTVRLTVGRNSGSSWKTVVNFANKKSGAVNQSFSFDAKGIGSSSAPQSFEKKHILKVEADGDTYGKWEIEVLINGELMQTVTATTSVEINEFLKPGKNTVTVRSTFTGDTRFPVNLTVGAEKGGKWATLLNYVNKKKGSYKKDFIIIAR
ncbi:MAG: hypothetical protein RDV48_16165 [Candidatus Eremiobacteraeota bacterium]|nr:hypothetical protein [Candidatus Eremiobacteraeota bacterium]